MNENCDVENLEITDNSINQNKKLRVFQVLIPVIMSVLVIVLFNTVFLLGIVPTESMAPTLDGDNNLIITYRLAKTYDVGDVIVFMHEGNRFVKRVAFCGGDTILFDGQITTIPNGEYFVLGDNTDNSLDSRYWDYPFVRENEIVGVVIFPSCKNQYAATLREPFIVNGGINP